jgi:CheY-like chemotaxis protein
MRLSGYRICISQYRPESALALCFRHSMAKLLCIDPDPSVSAWISRTLSRSGIDASLVTVATGKQGFHYLIAGDFDICVLEYCLPDITGAQFCTLMRQSGCSVPMVFFSAMNRPIDRERALTAKGNAFLAKPEDLELFVPTLKRLMPWPPSGHSAVNAGIARAA